MDGFASLFREIARGGATRQAGMADQQAQFMQQDYNRGRAEKALTDARIARDTELQRQQFAQALEGLGMDPQQAAGAGTLLRGDAGNFQQIARGLGQLMQNEGLSMARAAAERGDLPGMNPGLAIFDGNPLQTTRESGGVTFNPYAGPSQDVVTTPVGDATINSRNASAGAAMALEALRNAQRGTADARTGLVDAQARKAGAAAVIAEGDAEAMAAPIQKPNFSPPGAAPAVEASGAPATIRADIQQAVQRLGAARAATELDLPNVETKADYDALPSGAYFFDFVEGTVNRKP
jgi:hypothetical protein